MSEKVHHLAAGAAAGTLATAAMSALMLAGRKLGLTGELPPAKITRKALSQVFSRRTARALTPAAATAAHFGYGAGGGALLGILQGRRDKLGPVVHGALYGVAIWAVSYLGWVPAMDIMPMAHRDRPGRQAIMFLAHVVYGAATGALMGRLERSRRIPRNETTP